MKTVLIGCVLSLLAIFLIPTAAPEPQVPEPAQSQVLFIAQPGQAETESTPAPAAPEKTDEEEAIAGDASQLQLLCGGQTLTARVRDYLTSVVLCEMPVTFAPEALKAQAVAARTFLWKQAACKKHTDADVCADSACCQAWLCEDALREKFGADYEAAVKKAAQAVSETADEVLCYNGELIDATYFSCSGGSTEAAVAVWGTDVPYLQPVASPGEEYAARYESEASFSLDAFRSVITAADAAAAAEKQKNAAATDSLLQKKYVIPFILAVVILACNQTTGINSVLNYTVTIFQKTGMQGAFANMSDVAIKIMNCVMTVVACALVDKKGRKFLLKLGTSGIILGLCGVGTIFLAISKGWVAASMTTGVLATIFFVMFVAFYAVGPGVCVWLALTELMPTRIRATGMSIAMIINQGVSAGIATVFPWWCSATNDNGSVFFVLAGFTVIYFITAAFFLPETKGRTLEEVEQYFTTGKMPEKK